MSRRPAALILACLAVLMLSACAVEGDFASTPTLYVDEPVNRAWLPEIYVEPENPPIEPLTAVFIPLRIMPQMADAKLIGEELSRTFWNTWVQRRVFPGFGFAEGESWRTIDKARRIADGSGVDLIVGGEITHLMFGGAAGKTSISLRLKIYDAATGTLLWSMAHAGEMRSGLNKDFVVLTKKSRLPVSPAQAIMTALGEDMSKPVWRWNNGQPEEDPDAPTPME